MSTSVGDPHHVDANPDPAYRFDANPDPACHFDADPDPVTYGTLKVPSYDYETGSGHA